MIPPGILRAHYAQAAETHGASMPTLAQLIDALPGGLREHLAKHGSPEGESADVETVVRASCADAGLPLADQAGRARDGRRRRR